jgi:hypothetical protein
MRSALPEAAAKPELDLGELSRQRLEEMVEAGHEVVNVHRVLAKTGDNIVGEVLRGQGTFFEWDHYPKGDVYDPETHGQYYYHAHAADQRFPGEHGHFHTFLRPRGMPEGVQPASVPDFKQPADPNDALSHIIAISMDKQGLPFRLFTVNRWVTGETWYNAEDVIAMLDHFDIDHTKPSWPVNRWIGGLVRLFRPQIETLLHKRDETVADWQARHNDRNVYEDRELEVTSFVDISIDHQIQAVNEQLKAA